MRKRFAMGFWLLGLIVCAPALAHRGDSVECHSRGYQYTECAAEFRRPVLQEQLSDSECVENQTWGYKERRGVIWVTQGCAATFAESDDDDRASHRHRDRDDDDSPRRDDDERHGERHHHQREVTECRSSGYAFTRCDVEWSEARLVEQLSETRCVEGRSWGVDDQGLWVDKGCAGRFEGR